MKRLNVPPGTVFGYLTVIGEALERNGRRAVLCRCACGNQKAVDLSNLRTGNTKSCGCHGTAPDQVNLRPGEVQLYGRKARGRVALVDLEDFDLAAQHRWHVRETDPVAPGRRPNGPYAVTEIVQSDGRRRTITMHALIMGQPFIDHVNHNGLDNQRHNLRPATHVQNAGNSRKNPGKTSRYKGVFWDRWRSCWSAKITVNRQASSLGRYEREEDAALAYDIAAREAFGEYALTNFPGEPTPGARADLQARRDAEQGTLSAARGRRISAVKQQWWKDRSPTSHICTVCGDEFQSRANVAQVLYCSSACKSRRYQQRQRECREEGNAA